MKSINDLEPLLAPINALQRLIETFDNQGIIIGGIAASILGKPRLTADAERIIFWVQQFAELLEMPELAANIENMIKRTKGKPDG